MTYAAEKHSADLVGGVLTDVTAGGVTVGGAYLIAVCNRASTPTTIRVAITTTGTTPLAADWIAYDIPLGANNIDGGIVREWPVPLALNWRVYMQSGASNVSATVIGATS